MFGHRYYGARYYAPRYFGDGDDTAPEVPESVTGFASWQSAVVAGCVFLAVVCR